MRERKKKTIDGTDREILRFMNKANRPLSGNQLAKNVNIAPSAIRPRLNNLQGKGIVKPISIGMVRSFERDFKLSKGKTITKRINAPTSIKWKLDILKKKK